MLMRDYRVFKPDDRPDVEVLVDGAWCDGELRMWTQREDGSWWGNVAWRPPGEHTPTARHVPGRADPTGLVSLPAPLGVGVHEDRDEHAI
jgi:hypothetical protein